MAMLPNTSSVSANQSQTPIMAASPIYYLTTSGHTPMPAEQIRLMGFLRGQTIGVELNFQTNSNNCWLRSCVWRTDASSAWEVLWWCTTKFTFAYFYLLMCLTVLLFVGLVITWRPTVMLMVSGSTLTRVCLSNGEYEVCLRYSGWRT